MNKIIALNLTDTIEKEVFIQLVSALNAAGVTWGIDFDSCTGLIIVEIGEGY